MTNVSFSRTRRLGSAENISKDDESGSRMKIQTTAVAAATKISIIVVVNSGGSSSNTQR